MSTTASLLKDMIVLNDVCLQYHDIKSRLGHLTLIPQKQPRTSSHSQWLRSLKDSCITLYYLPQLSMCLGWPTKLSFSSRTKIKFPQYQDPSWARWIVGIGRFLYSNIYIVRSTWGTCDYYHYLAFSNQVLSVHDSLSPVMRLSVIRNDVCEYWLI